MTDFSHCRDRNCRRCPCRWWVIYFCHNLGWDGKEKRASMAIEGQGTLLNSLASKWTLSEALLLPYGTRMTLMIFGDFLMEVLFLYVGRSATNVLSTVATSASIAWSVMELWLHVAWLKVLWACRGMAQRNGCASVKLWRYMIVQHCDGRANGPMQKRYVLFAVQDYTLGDSIHAQYRGHQLIPA